MCPVAGFLLGGDVWRGRLVAHVLVVETPKDGLVLVDTGFGTRDIEGKTGLPTWFKHVVGPALDRQETAFEQVQALGFSPRDVRHIVVTHLDLDHAGGLGDFPDAKVHLHAREHAAALARRTLNEPGRYISAQWAHGPKWEVYSADRDTWRGLPANARLRGIAADIGLLPLRGHTRGHSALIVNAGARWLDHAGDAYFHRNSVEGNASLPVGFAAFARATQIASAARRASVAALRQLRARYAAHD